MVKIQKPSFRTVCVLLLSLLVIASLGMMVQAEGESLSKGKAYSFDTIPALHNYPDPARTKLTDGVVASDPDYMHPHWVGFWSPNPFSMTIDLGENTPIQQIRMHHMAGIAGITWPTRIVVQVFTAHGDSLEPLEMVVENVLPARPVTRWFSFEELDLEGRWIQITYVPPEEGKNIFVSEIEVR